jgi:hypothetical protein
MSLVPWPIGSAADVRGRLAGAGGRGQALNTEEDQACSEWIAPSCGPFPLQCWTRPRSWLLVRVPLLTCSGGGTGRHTCLRCMCRKACRFESCPEHHESIGGGRVRSREKRGFATPQPATSFRVSEPTTFGGEAVDQDSDIARRPLRAPPFLNTATPQLRGVKLRRSRSDARR